jgi:ferredoxin-NADP reductase
MSTIASSYKRDAARIKERRDLSEGLSLIRVKPGGQYTTLVVDQADQRIERADSIVSSPYEEGPEFLILTRATG